MIIIIIITIMIIIIKDAAVRGGREGRHPEKTNITLIDESSKNAFPP